MTPQELAYAEIKKKMSSTMFACLQFGATDCGVDSEIDRRVYVLYGLSEEEIKIVEGKSTSPDV
jgi:hypothetical protein